MLLGDIGHEAGGTFARHTPHMVIVSKWFLQRCPAWGGHRAAVRLFAWILLEMQVTSTMGNFWILPRRLRSAMSHIVLSVKLHLRDGRTYGRTNTHGNNVHRDRRRHAVSTSLRLVDRVKTQTDGRTDRRRWIEFGASVTSGGNNFNEFPDNQLTKFLVFLVDPGFLPPLNFYEASPFVPPVGWTPLTDTTDKETYLPAVMFYHLLWSKDVA